MHIGNQKNEKQEGGKEISPLVSCKKQKKSFPASHQQQCHFILANNQLHLFNNPYLDFECPLI